MFCNNCGAPLDEGTIFCNKCGARVEIENRTEVPAENAQENIPANVQENIPANVQENIPANVQEPSNADNVSTNVSPIKKKGKLGKILKISGISILGVAVATTIAAFASKPFRNWLAKTFLPSDSYLEYVVDENVKELSDGFNAKSLFSARTPKGAKGEIKFTVGDEVYNLAESFGGYYMDVDYIDWIKNVSIAFDSAVNGNKASVDMDLKLNDTMITELEYAFDLDKGCFYLKAPDFNSEAARFKFDYEVMNMMRQYTEGAAVAEELVNILPDEKTTKKLLTKYVKDFTKAIDDVKKESETITVEGVKQKLTVLSAKIDGDVLEGAAENILKDLKKDKDVEKLIKDFMNTSIGSQIGMSADDVYDEFLDAIDEALDEVDELGSFPASVRIDIYVDGNGDIVGFGMNEYGVKIRLVTVEKSKEFATIFEVKTPVSEGLEITVKGTRDGSSESANCTVKAFVGGNSAKEVVNINYTVDTDKLKQGEFIGNMTIKPGADLYDLIKDQIDNASIVSMILKGVDITINSTESSVGIKLNFNKQLIFGIDVNYTETGNTNVKIPSSYIDINLNSYNDYGTRRWTEGVDINNAANLIIGRLTKAGMPSSFAFQLMPPQQPEVTEEAEDEYTIVS